MNNLILGIDVGGTYTDGVIIDSKNDIIAVKKTPTQKNISESIDMLMCSYPKEIKSSIKFVHIGTTHGVNALLQGKNLFKVGIMRIQGHLPDLLPAGFAWPNYLKKEILAGQATVNGGVECDGRSIAEINYDEIKKQASVLIQKGAQAIAVVGVFSPLYPQQEKEVCEFLKKEFSIDCVESSNLGGLGIIERENATILNLSLKKSLKQAFLDCEDICRRNDINAKIYWVNNNGLLLDTENVSEFPLKTLAAGPTNSLIGGAKLAKLTNCVVLDIGGTSTDGGIIENGFVRISHDALKVAGIDSGSFSSDIQTINLGGGSVVDASQLFLTEESVACNLWEQNRKPTLTDAAICEELLEIENFSTQIIHKDFTAQIIKNGLDKLENLFEFLDPKKNYPHVLVGGAASIFKQSRFIIPKFCDVANAYGACLSKKGYSWQRTIDLFERDKTLKAAKESAYQEAIQSGLLAPKIIRVDVLPYHYMPGSKARVLIELCENQNI